MDRSKQAEIGGLEASLIQLIHAHNQSSIQLREHTDKAKKDAIEIAKRVSSLLVDSANGSVQEAFIMEKRIEMEIRALAAAVLQFGKQTDQWLAASHAINTAVKEEKVKPLLQLSLRVHDCAWDVYREIGDFENWMKTMEFDCKSINAAICNIHQA